MIDYHYLTDFQIDNEAEYSDWIDRIIISENATQGQLDFIFCDDEYLLKINQDYLQHDTFTDIITFPYGDDQNIAGDIFISVERVRENAKTFKVEFESELRRVMSHGILHMLGFGDKNDQEIQLMREKENEKLKLFHVEH
ncbi:rRNA maturation RNase YbeY [Arenibacter certesii]|uniref:Endoribonuclease YbeY n=1 Tax=Arenibacter certesii TaxID=228955 RepID=A0A918MQ35_9FLAO|nr:rRNA maturation RNase YbeY [Arenibacter certesii]GGW43579.1 endoribonuclease YbeY [Arenibacter certesii]